MPNRILVTGADGFIGKNIVLELIWQGYDVIATDITAKPNNRMDHLLTVPSDITKIDTLMPLVHQADAIIHAAGLVRLDAKADALDAVNHQGTKNLCEAIRQCNPKLEMLVHLSSIGVYGKNCRTPMYEEEKQMPRNPYEISKHNAEKAVKEYTKDFPITMLRPSFVYGIGFQHKDALPLFRMLQGKKVPFIKKGPRASHVHVQDVARAAVFLLNHKDLAGGAFNICNDSPICLEDFVRALAEPFEVEINPIMPYSPGAMKALRWCFNRVPKAGIRKANNYLQKKWDICREKYKIKEGLHPNLDTAWLDYLADEKVFSIEKLESVGFVLHHNSPIEELKATAKHYINMNLA